VEKTYRFGSKTYLIWEVGGGGGVPKALMKKIDPGYILNFRYSLDPVFKVLLSHAKNISNYFGLYPRTRESPVEALIPKSQNLAIFVRTNPSTPQIRV